MREKFIILRGSTTSTNDPFLGSRSIRPQADFDAFELRVEIEDIVRSKISILTNDPEVFAVAPVVPMKLISPVEIDGIDPTVNEEISWGVKAVRAITSPFSGDGIVVAVLDTGIEESHPAFKGVELVQKDFTGEGNGDQEGHGTHCAGTIFGRTSGGIQIGVASGVKKALIGKVLGSEGGSSDQIVNAIQWSLQNGANILSMSLGMDFPGYQKQLQESGLPPELATSRALEGYRANVQLFERLTSLVRSQIAFYQAMIIIAAAGNESRRNLNPNFEIAVSPPAVAEGIISVAALDQSNLGLKVASFSNTMANVSAPGVGIISAWPGGGLKILNGTSMAAPHVAGVAALWAEKILKSMPLNTSILSSRLISSATYMGMVEDFDPFDVGAGIVCAPQN